LLQERLGEPDLFIRDYSTTSPTIDFCPIFYHFQIFGVMEQDGKSDDFGPVIADLNDVSLIVPDAADSATHDSITIETTTVANHDAVVPAEGTELKTAPNLVEYDEVVEQPAEVAEQLAEVAEQPAEVAEQPVEVAEQPAEVAEQPAEVAEQPAEVAEQPAEVAEQPAEVAEQPVEVAEQPAEVAEQPAEVAEQPVEVAEQPVEVAEQPAEVAEQPVEVAEQPAAVAELIASVTGTATVTTAESIVNCPNDVSISAQEQLTVDTELVGEQQHFPPSSSATSGSEVSPSIEVPTGTAQSVATTASPPATSLKSSTDKKDKLESLRYGDKGKPSPATPKSTPKPDSDLLKMMKQSSTKLKSFDYSKLRGKKKDMGLSPDVLSPATSSSAPDRVTGPESPGNSLTPKKANINYRDWWTPPGGHFYEYEDLVEVNTTKIYGDLQENHLEAYLTSTDFEKVFSMKRVRLVLSYLLVVFCFHP
jgi:hypothetical protein